MIDIVMRQMPAEAIPQYKITVNNHDVGYVHRHEDKERWYVTGRDTVYVSKEAAACMSAARWFEQQARDRKKKEKSD